MSKVNKSGTINIGRKRERSNQEIVNEYYQQGGKVTEIKKEDKQKTKSKKEITTRQKKEEEPIDLMKEFPEIEVFYRNQEEELKPQVRRTESFKLLGPKRLPFILECMVCQEEHPSQFKYIQCRKCKTPICDRCYIMKSFSDTKGIDRACIICRPNLEEEIEIDGEDEKIKRSDLLIYNIYNNYPDCYYALDAPSEYTLEEFLDGVEPNLPMIKLNPNF